MKQRKNRTRRRLAGLLAAALVFTMTAPGITGYADGGSSTITFDPGSGPGLNKSTWSPVVSGPGTVSVGGQQGQLLNEVGIFKTLVEAGIKDTRGGIARPQVPGYAENIWSGYSFGGWYEKNNEGEYIGDLLPNLPPAFPYTANTTYYAKWIPSETQTYPLTVQYYRDFDAGRMAANDETAWPGEEDYDDSSKIRVFYKSSWNKGDMRVDRQVTALPRNDIPGYKVKDAIIKNNHSKDYNKNTTQEQPAKLNGNSLEGTMPNNNLTVAYRYVPDDKQKFPITIHYKEGTGDTAPTIHSDKILSFSVEDSYTDKGAPGAPAQSDVNGVKSEIIPGYIVTDVKLTKPDDLDVGDQNTGAIVSVNQAGGWNRAETGAGTQESPKQLYATGIMPNQPLEFTFIYERDPLVKTEVNVKYEDSHGGELAATSSEAALDSVVDIPVIRIEGYEYDPEGTPIQKPVRNYSGGVQYVGYASDEGILKVKVTGLTGGSVTLTYPEDYNQTGYWATVNFFNGEHGSFENNPSPLHVKISDHKTLQDVASALDPKHHADHNYEFKGWYEATAGGGKKNDIKLSPEMEIGSSINLYAEFGEQEGAWGDIEFRCASDAHGTIDGLTQRHVAFDTKWADVVPQNTPDPGYVLDGWYDKDGRKMPDPADEDYGTASVGHGSPFTVKFKPLVNVPAYPQTPDAQGSIGADGAGRIKVNGPNTSRSYMVTAMDEEGNEVILQIKTGLELQAQNAGFTGLAPCSTYKVYEIIQNNGLSEGDSIASLYNTEKSLPAQVYIPAVDSNYHVTQADGGKKQIEIRPAAPDTSYAVLDPEGTPVSVPGSAEGWVTAQPGTATVILGGLEPNQIYTIVAKKNSESTLPAAKLDLGTQCPTGSGSPQEAQYTLQLLGGASVTAITRKGQPLELPEDPNSAVVMKGDQITITADVPGGKVFDHWEVLLGDSSLLTGSNGTYPAPTITMPAANQVIQVVYRDSTPPPAGQGSLKLDWSRTGAVTLDLSEEQQTDIKDAIQTALSASASDADENELSHGRDVTYTVKLTQKRAPASVSDAVKEQVADLAEGPGGEYPMAFNDVKTPWIIRSTLTRAVGGTAIEELPAGLPEALEEGTIPIKLYTELDPSQLGGLEYLIYPYDSTDPDHPELGAPIHLTPDPASFNPGGVEGDNPVFTGVITFDAKVGQSYIMTYQKASDVTIKDTKRLSSTTLKVRKGAPLEAADGFDEDAYSQPYVDPQDTGHGKGALWNGEGLGANENPDTPSYDTSEPVHDDETLFIHYKLNEDWQTARNLLKEKISVANTLMGNPFLRAEDKAALEAAIVPAWNAVNDPDSSDLPTKDTFQQLYGNLDDIINGIHLMPPNPNPDPGPPDPNPPHPDNPGGGGSGGGSGGGGSGGGGGGGGGGHTANLQREEKPLGPAYSGVGPGYDFNHYKTYRSGSDGSWNTVGGDSSRWNFTLTDGRKITDQWVNVRYDDQRGACTYHFDREGIMNYGWYIDETGASYFLNPVQGPDFGRLTLGWYQDTPTGNWYYFNQLDGRMQTGWQQIGDSWYYLSPNAQEGHPLGTLYTGGVTPDGSQVNADGKRIG